MNRFFTAVFILLFCGEVVGQDLYYVRRDWATGTNYYGVFNIATCHDSTIHLLPPPFGVPVGSFQDVAISPEGRVFMLISQSGLKLVEYFPLSNTFALIEHFPLGTSGNSLTCSAENILYFIGGAKAFSYDLNTSTLTYLGPPGYFSAGDLTFYQGVLYGNSGDNWLHQVNLEPVVGSTPVFQFNIPSGMISWGVISVSETCDNGAIYLTATNPYDNYTTNHLYRIDPVAHTVEFLCNTPGAINGAASPDEFRSSDCRVHVDLNGMLPGKNDTLYSACSPGAVHDFAVDTSVARFYSGYRMGEMHIRFAQPPPDGSLEYLSVQAGPLLTSTGQNTQALQLTAAVGASDGEFQAALRTLRYHNTAGAPTPGLRLLEVMGRAQSGRSDTAFVWLYVPVPTPDAGADTALAVCADAPAFALQSVLPGASILPGSWLNAPGNPVFTPGTDTAGTFRFVAGDTMGVCPVDTVSLTVSYLPLPVFSLGTDTILCAGQSLTLQTPGTALWSDGQLQSSFTAAQSGVYWSEYTGANGCRFRDSVWVEVLPPVAAGNTLYTLCAGQTYQWNSMMFSRDTSLCLTLLAVNGCDSTDCLSLSVFYPSLALDTAVCSDETLLWQGKIYTQPGLYADTILLNGCLHAVSLTLAHTPLVSLQLTDTLCGGDTLWVHGTAYSTGGSYSLLLAGTAGACDTLLNLTLWDAPPLTGLSIMGDTVLCEGATGILSAPLGFAGYTWSLPGQQSASLAVTAAGTYGLTVSDAYGCTGTWAQSVSVLPASPPGETTVSQCAGQSYIWNSITISRDTSVCVTLAAYNGCDSTDCLDYSVFYPALALDTAVCFGEPVFWQGQFFSSPGIYTDTVWMNGCLHATSLVLSNATLPEMTYADTLCAGDTLRRHGQAYYQSGNYTYILPGAGGTACDTIVAQAVVVAPMPAVALAGDTLLCAGSSGQLEAPEGYSSYTWNTGHDEPLLAVDLPGQYAVTVIDQRGCTAAAAAVVRLVPPLEVTWEVRDESCGGNGDGSIAAGVASGGLAPYKFRLNGALLAEESVFENLSPGEYTVQGEDAAGCRTEIDTLVVSAGITIAVQVLPPDTTVFRGDTVQLQVVVTPAGVYTYEWQQPVVGLTCSGCASPQVYAMYHTAYTVVATDASGCTGISSVQFRVLAREPILYAPTVIAPEGREENAVFTLYGDGRDFTSIELLRVYDRWGGLVYEGRNLPLGDLTQGWDGRAGGKTCLPGVYVFYARVIQSDGSIKEHKGDVTVVR